MNRILIAHLLIVAAVVLDGCSRKDALSTNSPDALRLYNEGVAQLDKFYYTEAQSSFEQALKYDSTFGMAWARLATVNSMNQNEPAAFADIARAVALARHATERERLLISIWNHRLHFETRAAMDAVDSLIRGYPDEKEAYMLRGNLNEQMKNYEGAISDYHKAIETDTGYALAVMYLGYAYSAIGEQEQALEQMQRYIRLAPDAADSRASYADLLVRAGRYDEAMTQYQKSLELKPDYWYSVRETGTIDAIKGKLRDAESQYHKAAGLLPMSRQLQASYLALDAHLDLLRHDYAGALRRFNEALSLDTSNFGGAFGAVYALGKLKRFREAEQMTSRIREEFRRRNLLEGPSMLGFHLMKARLLTDEGDFPDALASCDSALAFSVRLTRTAVYYQMAEIYRRQKNFESALDACSEALSMNPNQPEALLTLVRIYSEKNDSLMTGEIGGRLLSLWSGADADYQNLIELRRLLGKHPPV